ncbi:MAG: hypothetical protein GY716_23305 [bacterium]|nr:hypothetical protein [bacterium]
MSENVRPAIAVLSLLLALGSWPARGEIAHMEKYPVAPPPTDEVVDLGPRGTTIDPSFAGTVYRISGALVAGGTVLEYSATSDGQTVVYRADAVTDGVGELFSVPIAGGATTRLNQNLVASGDVLDYGIAPGDEYVVFRADANVDERTELFSVPVGGGTPVRVHPEMPAGGDVILWRFSGDRVIVVADIETNGTFDIYSTPVEGGASIRLNGTLPAGGNTNGILVRDELVQYLAEQDTVGLVELYVVPDTGGTSVKLSGTFAAGSNGVNTSSAGEDNHTIYIADQDVPAQYEAYGVASTGGTPIKLSGAMVGGGDINRVSATRDRAVYRGDQDTDAVDELYSVPWSGGPPTRLNDPLVPSGDVDSYKVSIYSDRVVYLADQDIDNVQELYSVPLTGGTVIKLHEPLPVGGDVGSDYQLPDSERSDRVLYRRQPTQGITRFEMFSVPIGGGTPTPLGVGNPRGVTGFRRTPSGIVLYKSIPPSGGFGNAIYIDALVGGQASPALNPAPGSTDVATASVAGDRIMFATDLSVPNQDEIFGVRLIEDGDNDGVLDGVDCLVYDADVWSLPTEADALTLAESAGTTTLTFSGPSDSGAAPGGLGFDVLRSTSPDDFGTSALTCLEVGDTDLEALDGEQPPAGTVFHYLVRARNTCGPGTSGAASDGADREAGFCL